MHGVIFQLLQQFIEKKLGQGSWAGVAQSAGLQFKVYLATSPYPVEEARALLDALTNKTTEDFNAIVEAFGRFVVPNLLSTFSHRFDPSWRTLEIIEETEKIIKELLADEGYVGTALPKLKCRRKSSNLLIVNYEEPRELCAFVAGLIKGLGEHFDETITVNEVTCQITSGGSCQFLVRRARI